MEISVNNKQEKLNEGISLEQLVTNHLGDKIKGVAVAVNETVIPKDQWNAFTLKANDNVLIIKATQGG